MDDVNNCLSDVQPLCIFLAVKGTKGDRLLFKYPYEDDILPIPAFNANSIAVRGALPSSTSSFVPRLQRTAPKLSEDDPWIPPVYNCNETLIENGKLVGLTDDILGYLFAVRSGVCGQQMEVKINDVRFVCFPTLLPQPGAGEQLDANAELPTLLLFNIVFALRANTKQSFVRCYQDLSQRLAIALRYEEARCRYLSKQARIMLECQEEAQSLPEACQESPYKLILPKSELAQDLKIAFEDVTTTGYVNVKINRWIEVSYCLPHKVHWMPGLGIFEPEKLQRLLAAIRPYHGMLLLCDQKELLERLPLDGSPTLPRLLNVYTPLKSFQTLSFDCGIPLSQVMKLAEHLVYWGKALVIYPLCETNVYVISPLAQLHSKQLAAEFASGFPKQNFLVALSEFSNPTSLGEFTNPLAHEPHQQSERVKMVVWFLGHRLIMQLHTYVYLLLDEEDESNESDTSVEEKLYDVCLNDSNFDSPMSASSIEETENIVLDQASQCIVRKLPQELKRMDDSLKLFLRLCKYFNGEHHLEDIMYSENLRRTDLIQILAKFQNVLCTCQLEDKLSAVLLEKSSDETSSWT